MESDLDSLRQRWLTTRRFEDEQSYLAARVRLKDVQFVGLDADGTFAPWLAVVIRHPTGVVYGASCAGVSTEERLIEGYLILLGGSEYDAPDRRIDPSAMNQPFHEGEACMWNWKGRELPEERLQKLRFLVQQIPYWKCDLDGQDVRYQLRFDRDRINQIAEAWIPVETPDGLGVLLYKNCD